MRSRSARRPATLHSLAYSCQRLHKKRTRISLLLQNRLSMSASCLFLPFAIPTFCRCLAISRPAPHAEPISTRFGSFTITFFFVAHNQCKIAGGGPGTSTPGVACGDVQVNDPESAPKIGTYVYVIDPLVGTGPAGAAAAMIKPPLVNAPLSIDIS